MVFQILLFILQKILEFFEEQLTISEAVDIIEVLDGITVGYRSIVDD